MLSDTRDNVNASVPRIIHPGLRVPSVDVGERRELRGGKGIMKKRGTQSSKGGVGQQRQIEGRWVRKASLGLQMLRT